MDVSEVLTNLKGTTLKKYKNQTFKNLEPFEVKKDTCKCGKEYESSYLMFIPPKDEPIHYKNEMCGECEEESKRLEQLKEIEENNKRRAEEKEKERKRRFLEIFDDFSLMNPKLKTVTFDDYKPTSDQLEKAKQITNRYADNFSLENPVSLLLIGNYGTGKSHLSAAITKSLISKEFTCVFVSTPKLLTKIRSTYNKTSFYSEDAIMKTLSEVDCLILDDIGSETTKVGDDNQHTWGTSKIFEIIDNRIGKHTIFTSNYEPSELQERLGGRNFSRMMENTHVIKMYGDDYRLRSFK
jgi:DNA replication protein DnaC